jgi:uncharacterized DUF497 family protein
MSPHSIVWDLDDDPTGNVQHCLANGVTMIEIEDVFQDPRSRGGISRSSERPVTFGITRGGRHLIVVYERIDEETIYPVTAYDVE